MKQKNFTLIELLVKKSHLCCNRTDDSENRYSPAHGQVKLYSFPYRALWLSAMPGAKLPPVSRL